MWVGGKLKSNPMVHRGSQKCFPFQTKVTLLKREAGVSGMRLGEVADHPFSNRDLKKDIWKGLEGKDQSKYFLKCPSFSGNSANGYVKVHPAYFGEDAVLLLV